MLRERLEFASDMFSDVNGAESAVDDAFSAVSKLLTAMDAGRRKTGLDRRTGHDGFTHVASAVALLGQVRSELFQAHDALKAAGPTVLPTVDWGDQGCTKPEGVIKTMLARFANPLRSVA